ncbi:MAG: hypothetical protein FJX42_05730 [Alphaproteobacteria bacterium]|nr:hypothetical protein [Alphaproteobacteria bacterium]
MLGIHDVREGVRNYRVLVCNMIARERAELGLPVVEKLRPWIKTQEQTIRAESETDAWEKAYEMFPPTEGYFIESLLPIRKTV